MGLGFSFGKKKSSSTTDSTMTKNEVGTESSVGSQEQTSNSASSTSQTGSSSTASQQAGTSSTQQNTQAERTGQQTQTTQNFSDSILGSIEKAVGSMLGSSNLGGAKDISSFDPAAFVSKGVEAVRSRAQSGLDETLGGIMDAIGGKNNSMVALLSQRAQNDANAAISGAEAGLMSQAEQIQRENLLAGAQLGNNESNLLNSLLGALKGGVTSTTGTTAEQSNQAQTGFANTTQTGTENTNTSQESQTQAVQTLLSLVEQLVNSSSSVTATEHSKTKGKSGGGGISVSI